MIVEPDFLEHWKTRMLIDLLDGDERAPIYLIRLWAHCQNRKTYTFQEMSSVALKALCRYAGNPNKLESAMVTSGFVRRENQVLVVVGWEKCNASLIASWENGGKGGRPKKHKKQQGNNPDETHGLPTGNPQVTHRLPTENPDETDKRREDKNINTTPIGNGKYANEDKPKIQQPPIDETKQKITFFGLPEVTETTKELLGESMRKINELYPPWSKRPHWTRAEMEKLLANIGFISDITDRDWKLLGFYLRSNIPPEFKKSEGDLWQPDHRGSLVEHISGVLSNADRLIAECRRKGWKLPDELK